VTSLKTQRNRMLRLKHLHKQRTIMINTSGL
jgi:hypothetical protein